MAKQVETNLRDKVSEVLVEKEELETELHKCVTFRLRNRRSPC